MTLEQLRVLQTISKTGSFRAASQELHRAQSALSYSIRTLEDELGFRIFNRDQYRPQLTPQGRAFLKKADDLIFQFSELEETAEFLKRGHEPIIRLAVSALWPLPELAGALKELNKKFPQTEIKIVHDVLSADELLLGDLADIALGSVFNEKGLLTTEKLFNVRMIAACSASHPLAQFRGRAPEKELRAHPQIIMSSTVKTTARAAAILNPESTISVQDYFTKKAFLLEGLGWGFMPEHVVSEEIKRKTLVTLMQKSHIAPTHIARHSQKELGPCGIFLWNYFSNRQKKKVK